MLRNTLTASAASASRSVVATSATSSPLYGYIITRTSSSSSSSSSRTPTRAPRQSHRRQSNLTYRLFEKAGLDLEEAHSRREDALARGEKPDVEEQGWKRSGLGWKVRRGNMMARQRRGYASLAGQEQEQTQTQTPRSVVHHRRRPPGEIRPGDLIQYPSVDGHAWGIVLPCHPVLHLFQTKQFFALSSFGTITLLKQSAVVMHLPDLLASEEGEVDAKRATIGEKEAMLLVEEATGLSGKDEIAARLDETVSGRAKAARARMAARLRRVVKEADDELEQLHGRLAHAMAVEEEGLLQRDEVGVEEVAAMLIDGEGEGPAPTSTLIATHKLLTSMPRYFIHLPPAKAYKMAQTYAIRPQGERDLLDKVEGWRRTRDSPIDAFAGAVKAGGKVETSHHSEILEFLLLSLSSTTSEGQSDPFAPTVDAILKRCDRLPVVPPAPYGEAQWAGADRSRERRQAAVVDLLEGVGAVQGGKGTDWSLAGGRSRRWLECAARRTEEQQHGATVEPSDEDLDATLRRPFHSPVFIIDDATAHELDDGISVSPTPHPDDGSVWVHIHIADPTSHLTPSSYPAQHARRQGSTLYLSNGASIPMFPRGSTRGIDEEDERGVRRVVTFSARVSLQGEVVETKVGCSDLQGEVRKITYDDVDAGRVVGHGKELKTFADVADRLLKARIKAGALSINDTDSRLQLGITSAGSNVPTITTTPTSPQQADHQGSRPSLLIPTTSTTPTQHSPSRRHVAEYMILAGRIASDFLWRQEGGMAAVYRSQRFPDEVAGKWKAALRRRGGGGGDGEGGNPLGRADVLKLGIAMPSAVSRSTPDEHVTMGIASHPTTHSPSNSNSGGDLLHGSGYLRVTSPLRRYEDVVAHWQIKAALHGRHDEVMTLEEMDAELPEISRRAEAVQGISKGSGDWWRYRALRLALEGRGQTQTQQPAGTATATADRQTEAEAEVDKDRDGWRPLTSHDLRVGAGGKPLTAYVLDGSLSMDDLSLSCMTRVTLPELGRGINAECLWPMNVAEGNGKGGLVMEMPKMGQEVKVEVVGVRESIERGGRVAARPVNERVEDRLG